MVYDLKAIKILHDVTNRMVYNLVSEFFRLAGYYIGEGIVDEYDREEYRKDGDCIQLFLCISVEKRDICDFLEQNSLYLHIDPTEYEKEEKVPFLIQLLGRVEEVLCTASVQFPERLLKEMAEIYVENDLCRASYNMQYYRMRSEIHQFSFNAYKSALSALERLQPGQGEEVYLGYAKLYCKQKINLSCYYQDEKAVQYSVEKLEQECIGFIEKYPQFSNAKVLLGMIYEIFHYSIKKAINAYLAALDMEGKNCYAAHIYYWIGKLYEMYRSGHDEAKKAYTKAYDFKKKYRNIYKMAMMADAEEEYENAFRYFKECLDMLKPRMDSFMDPLEMEYYFKICVLACYNCCVRREDYQQAIRYGEEAIAFYENYVENTSIFAVIYGEDAEKYRELTKKRMKKKKIYQYLAIAYRETGDMEKSESYWKKGEK